MTKLAILDMDGTILDLSLDIEHLIHQLRKINGSIRHPLLATVERSDKKVLLYNMIDESETKAAKLASEKDGAATCLGQLKLKGYKIALVTLQGRKGTFVALRRLGVLNFFDLIITREDSRLRLEQITLALRRFHVNSNQAIMVGDRESDREAALALGCRFFHSIDDVMNVILK